MKSRIRQTASFLQSATSLNNDLPFQEAKASRLLPSAIQRAAVVFDTPQMRAAARTEPDRKAIEAKVHEYVSEWRALLTKRVEDGRQLLREVLAGPLRFTPEGKTYRFEGEAAIGRLLAGMAGVAPFVASPTGTVNSCNARFQGIAA